MISAAYAGSIKERKAGKRSYNRNYLWTSQWRKNIGSSEIHGKRKFYFQKFLIEEDAALEEEVEGSYNRAEIMCAETEYSGLSLGLIM